MNKPLSFAFACLFAATVTSGAQAGHRSASVDFSACTNYQLAVGQPVGASVGNAMTKDSMLSFTLLDPAAGNNAWVGGAGGASIDISLAIVSPSTVDMLLNSFYGQSGISNAKVTFIGTNKTKKSFNMIGNATIRDYNNWVWTNTINNKSAQEWWTNNLDPQPQDQSKRLDAHVFKLGKTFAGQTLTDIIITAPANAGVNYMEPALFAVDLVYPGAHGVAPSTCTLQ